MTNPHSLVPTPKKIFTSDGQLSLNARRVTYSVMGVAESDRDILQNRLNEFSLTTLTDDLADISFLFDNSLKSEEGYELKVTLEGISIRSNNLLGALHGIETLKQLTDPNIYRSFMSTRMFKFPVCEIHDNPSIRWRGGLLDIARHFYDKDVILKTIDLFAVHKINYLQLHLTDDQGWRIESTKFPLLNSVGSFRKETQLSHFAEEKRFDSTPHGGFLSKEDIREIVAHAHSRGIVVVPEIELPGHTGALLAAYPEFGIPKGERDVSTSWGIFKSLLSPVPKTIAFVEEILEEIFELFPSPWIHVGGDESLQDIWLEDEEIQSLMQENKLTSTQELFTNFMSQIGAFARSKGRTIITWDDAFASGFRNDTETVIMAWRGTKIAQRAAKSGLEVILAPVVPFYFDYYQEESIDEPQAIGGPISVADVLAFDTQDLGWSEAENSKLLGCQFQLWTEFIRSSKQVEYMMWPRATAFAEIMWNGKPSDLESFEQLFLKHALRLEALNVNFRPIKGPHPWQKAGNGVNAHVLGWDFHERTEAWDTAAQAEDLIYTPPPSVVLND